jgi:hypothetical protein
MVSIDDHASLEDLLKRARIARMKIGAARASLFLLAATAGLAVATNAEFKIPGVDLKVPGQTGWIVIAPLAFYFTVQEWLQTAQVALSLGVLIVLDQRGVLARGWRTRWDRSAGELAELQSGRIPPKDGYESGAPAVLVWPFRISVKIGAWILDRGTVWIFCTSLVAAIHSVVLSLFGASNLQFVDLIRAAGLGIAGAGIIGDTAMEPDELWAYICTKKELWSQVLQEASDVKTQLATRQHA